MQTTANVRVWWIGAGRPKVRAWLFQILAVIRRRSGARLVFCLTTQTNLETRHYVRVLNNSAGFGIAQHLIDYTESDTYGRVFLVGATEHLAGVR
jgi:general L-amino acid transport system permease protein